MTERQKLSQADLVLGGDNRHRVPRVRSLPAGELVPLHALACPATGGAPFSGAGELRTDRRRCELAPQRPLPPASGNGINLRSPAFASALRACEKYLPHSSGHEQPISASERLNEIALATCMRANGVANFPDPGPYGIQIPIGQRPQSTVASLPKRPEGVQEVPDPVTTLSTDERNVDGQ
jgi:hypothetical protein